MTSSNRFGGTRPTTGAVDIREGWITRGGHKSFYLAAGPIDGPLIMFVHGWPNLSAAWAPLLKHFGGLGFHAVAPDLRGYGRSTVYRSHADYAQQHLVEDMLALLDGLGGSLAIWVGHDWGSPVVWNLANHYPEQVAGVVSLTIPYRTVERGARSMLPLVNRAIYPKDVYPYGPWEYQRFYHERFDRATRVFDADPARTLNALIRRGNPEAVGKPTGHASVFQSDGWFNGADVAPDMPIDDRLLSEADLEFMTESFRRTGFFGPNAFYMNDAANLAYSDRAVQDGYLDLPALFIGGRFDITCDITHSRLAEPMEHYCRDLTVAMIDTGHWMVQEKPEEVTTMIERWIVDKLPTMLPSGWPRAS